MTKRKIARSAGSILLSLALAVSGIAPGASSVMSVHAEDTTATIVPATESGDDREGTGEMNITLNYTKAIKSDWITLDESSLTYNGSAQIPTVTVKDPSVGGAQALTKDTDYTVTITKNGSEEAVAEPVNVGEYTITITAKEGSYYTGSSTTSYEITRSTPEAPAAPKVESKSKTSVTLVATEGCEYSMDGENWQKGTEFAGLLVGTEYRFYQRVAATDNNNASEKSEARTVSTDEDTYSMTITLVIEQASVETAPKANDLTYIGEEQALTTAGKAKAGTMQYQIGEDDKTAPKGEWSDSVPTGKESGTYYVWYRAYVNDNNVSEAVPVKVTIASVDKAKLKKAIEEAEAYYNKIKDNADYKEQAKALSDAISKAEKIASDNNVKADEVGKGITAINKAKDDAQAAVKNIDDTAAAKKVIDAINALPASDKVATTDKAAIEAARKAFDVLTADQKNKVPADVLKKLEDAEKALTAAGGADNVIEKINALPASDKVAITDKAAVTAARAAYDALTADQKAKVPADTFKKLADAEKALADAEAADKAAKELEAAKEEAQAAMNEQVTVTQKGSKFTVKWTKASSADGYYVYASYCGKKAAKPVKTIKKNNTTKTTITKIDGKKISASKNFHVYVVPYKIIDGKNVTLGKSTVAHVVGSKNTKYSNVKKLTLTKSKYTVKAGKTAKIKAKVTLVNKNRKHIPKSHGAKFRYKSSDEGIATVDNNGKIKGISKGTCTIYVYSINGLMKKAKVTVK